MLRTRIISEKRQTMLFSATTTKKTEDLIKVALKKEPIYIGLEDRAADGAATVMGLEQGYVICPSEKRLLLLFTFLKKNRKKKVMVFFSSCMSVKYHNELFNYIDLPVMCIHVRLEIHWKSIDKSFILSLAISTGQTKANETNHDLLPILQRW